MDKVEEKLLESCLCSEKESVLTVRAVLQKCPGQGLRTEGVRGKRATRALAARGSLPTRSSVQAMGPGSQGALKPWLAQPASVSAPPQCLQLVSHLLQLCLDG